jgi:hypothetical protein
MIKARRQLLGVFADPRAAAAAARALTRDGDCQVEVYAPVPDHVLLDSVPRRRNPVAAFTVAGGVTGLVGGFALAFWSASLFELYLSGKPWNAYVAFIVIAFEFTVLLSGLFAALGMLVSARLPRLFAPRLWDPRLSEDRFGVGVDCEACLADRFAGVLEAHGADHVHRAS